MIDQTLYYVVRAGETGEPYAIWEMTAEAMAERVEKDSTLVKRLDRAPFKTRAEAEKRRNELNSGQP
jgi:hypothetical protein